MICDLLTEVSKSNSYINHGQLIIIYKEMIGKLDFYIKNIKYPHLTLVFQLQNIHLELSICPHR